MPEELERKPLPKRGRLELEAIAAELREVLAEKKAMAAREAALKGRIKALALRYDLPFAKGSTQYLNLPDITESLRVGRPEKRLKIVPELLRDAVGCELFHRVFTIRDGDLDLDKWLMLQDMEMVTEGQLLAAIPPEVPGAEESITISFGKAFDPAAAE